MTDFLKELPLPTSLLPTPTPPTFGLPPLYAFSYAPALLLFCILLQPSIPARVSTFGRRFLLLPTLVFVTIAPFRWRLSPIPFSVPFNFRLSIFGPDLILKALEWGLMEEKDRQTKLAWVGFKEKEEDETEEGKKQAQQDEGISTAVPANKLKVRLENLEVDSQSRTPSSTSSSGTNSPFSIRNLALGQLPTPQTSQLPTPHISPPPTPIDPITAAAPPPLHDTQESTLAKLEVRSQAAKATATKQHLHPMRVLIDACHFLSAMRGNGYAFAQSNAPTKHRSHHRAQARRLPVSEFLRGQAVQFVRSQIVSTACMAYQVLHRDEQIAPFLVSRFPQLGSTHARSLVTHLVNSTAYITVGVSLYCQMLIGYSGAALGIVLTSLAVNSLLDRYTTDVKWRWSFDSREYPPLFDAPFGKMGEGGVSSFWGFRWHALFKAPFTAIGFNPVMRLSRKLGLPKALGRFLAVYCVFLLSAWMHVQAFAAARWNSEPSLENRLWAASLNIPMSSLTPAPWSELSFRERHGTFIFFLAQPIAIALESLYLSTSGSGKKRRIGGAYGRIWTMAWVAGLGAWAVGKSWLALGLAHGVPPIHRGEWTWPRYVLPTAHLCPAPLFMKTV
ncbi:wax synthase family protein [Sporobolomyces salmoneus]|uniref:wax synthase family protein n=1 Tax=Sporobolomyces salmoneus TaxID=183962 RepID=UPI00317C59A9